MCEKKPALYQALAFMYVSQRLLLWERAANRNSPPLKADALIADTVAYVESAIAHGQNRFTSRVSSEELTDNGGDGNNDDNDDEELAGADLLSADSGVEADGTNTGLNLNYLAQLCRLADTAGRMGVDAVVMNELYEFCVHLRQGGWSAASATTVAAFERGPTTRARLDTEDSTRGKFVSDWERLVAAHSFIVASTLFRLHHGVDTYATASAQFAASTVLPRQPQRQPKLSAFYESPSASLPARCIVVGAGRLLAAPFRLHKLYESARLEGSWCEDAEFASGLWQGVHPPTGAVLRNLAAGVRAALGCLEQPGVLAEFAEPQLLDELRVCGEEAAARLADEADAEADYQADRRTERVYGYDAPTPPKAQRLPSELTADLANVLAKTSAHVHPLRGRQTEVTNRLMDAHRAAAMALRTLSNVAADAVGKYNYR